MCLQTARYKAPWRQAVCKILKLSQRRWPTRDRDRRNLGQNCAEADLRKPGIPLCSDAFPLSHLCMSQGYAVRGPKQEAAREPLFTCRKSCRIHCSDAITASMLGTCFGCKLCGCDLQCTHGPQDKCQAPGARRLAPRGSESQA